MNTEQNQKVLLEQLEALKKENEQLKKELSILRNENISNRPVSFKEKYAVRILDSLPDMLTVFNQNEVGIEVVSNEETNHVGISNKDFKGMYMREMVPPEAYQNIHSNMRQAVSTGAVSTAHHELDFNGEHHHYENRIFPLDEEYVLIMCRDITERVTTQRQLEVFKSVLDKVSDSILAVSEDGTLVYANKQFIEEYGVTQQMGIQKIYDLPVSMTTKEAWERRLQEIRDNDGTFAYRAAYMRKGEDKERMHQVSTFLIRENNEELTWFFTQDITDVIKKQDELRELNLLLDGILNNIPVYLFVKDPENDFRYLYWNKAFADHSGIPASKAIGHTDYEVFPSHGDAEKFRKDDLELLQTHKRIDMQETYLSVTGKARIVQTLKALVPMEGRKPLLIGISWDILLQLINDILDLSKIEAGTLEYIKRPMNLGEVCRTIYAVHKERVKEGVTLVFDNEDENLFIEGDQNRIMQVITNFLTNASKFTYAGEIRLGFERTDKNIRVYVKDTGIGIEPEKVDHVFERFVKLNSFAQGTGLGLSICQMIIEKIGGEIGVTSELGKGSTFYFTIPYEEAGELGEIFKMSKTESKGNTVNRVQQIKKILEAEDVESNFILLKNLIGREYTLLWAKDGVEAIEMYKQYQPDLILMDIKMPRMDGLEATHIIRSYSKDIPIIALTAYAFETDKELALEMGCNDFVTKPVSERTLRKALDKYSTIV